MKPDRIRLRAAAIAFLSLALLAAAPATDTDALYNRCLKSAVWVVTVHGSKQEEVTVPGRQGVRLVNGVEYGVGSGALIDGEQRLILTNAHVVGNNEKALVYFPVYRADQPVKDQRWYWKSDCRSTGKVIAKDTNRDLALIKIEKMPSRFQALPLADENPKAGDRVHSIGNPGESHKMWMFRSGTIDAARREHAHALDTQGRVQDFVMVCRMLHLSMKTEHGESGSPVVNDRGELMGVIWGVSPTSGQAYAVDVREVRSLLAAKHLTIHKPAASIPKSIEAALDESVKSIPTEGDAARRLKLARQMIDGLRLDNARERLQEIVRDFPETQAAADARTLLEDLGP